MPLSRMGFYPLWGLPYLAPEIVLLFKAKHLEARDRIDFDNALPALSADARRWLRDAIEKRIRVTNGSRALNGKVEN